MRFAIQPSVMEGLRLASPALAARAAALTRTDDWSTLDLETQALGLTLAASSQTQRWLEALALTEPCRALALALQTAGVTLRFARAGDVIVRVPEPTARPSSAALPTAEFWRELRRSLDLDPALRDAARAVAAARPPADVRLRAGLAFVFPDEPRWWTAAERRAASRRAAPEDEALTLLAEHRDDPRALACVVWPPPYAVRNPRSTPGPAELKSALREFTSARGWSRLAHVAPTPALLAEARALPPPRRPLQRSLRALVLERWADELGLPPVGPRLGAEDAVRLRAALRHDDAAAIAALARRAEPSALTHFASTLLVQWLLDQCPDDGQWAATALGWALTDEWADLLAELATRWARPGPDAGPVLLAALARAGTARALRHLSRINGAVVPIELRATASEVLERHAAEQQLSRFELEDRLFPPLVLPAGAAVRVEPGPRVVLERDGAPLELDAAWRAALTPLALAIHRLEHLMREGEPLSVVHFTETWGMHPLLAAVARGVVWGVYRGEARVGLLVPGRAEAGALDADVRLRPVHPLELSPLERHEAARWLSGPQPFEQLALGDEWPLELAVAVNDREAFGRHLRRAGWDVTADGWARHEDGWSVEVTIDAEDELPPGEVPTAAGVLVGRPPRGAAREALEALLDAARIRRP